MLVMRLLHWCCWRDSSCFIECSLHGLLCEAGPDGLFVLRSGDGHAQDNMYVTKSQLFRKSAGGKFVPANPHVTPKPIFQPVSMTTVLFYVPFPLTFPCLFFFFFFYLSAHPTTLALCGIQFIDSTLSVCSYVSSDDLFLYLLNL